MELYVFTPALDLYGVLDNFQSLTWVSRYYTAGEFTITAPLTTKSLELLRRGNVVSFGSKNGYIETVELTMEDGVETITAIGRSLVGYLARRINWGTINYTGTAEGFMRKIVSDNCIACTPDRIIPGLSLASPGGFTGSFSKQNSYGNVLEVLEDVAKSSGLGYRIVLNAASKTLSFEVYQGTDHRSVSADPVIFSRSMENMLTQVYYDSINSHSNTALIGGQGEGSSRTTASIISGTGLARYELFVDAKDLQSALGDVTLTAAEYEALLLQRGQEALAERPIIQTLDGTINHLVSASAGLGDLVTVLDPTWGITMHTRITEIEEIYENQGTTINVTFGGGVPTLTDKIRKGMI